MSGCRACAASLAALALFAGPLPAEAQSTTAPQVLVSDAWIRAAPPGAGALGAYLHLENRGSRPVTVVGADSPDFGSVQLHRTEIAGGVASMRHEPRLSIPGGGRIVLEPGARHLMLMRPLRPLPVGARAVIRLLLDDGRSVQFLAPVRALQD